jgi:hypothetical protein
MRALGYACAAHLCCILYGLEDGVDVAFVRFVGYKNLDVV